MLGGPWAICRASSPPIGSPSRSTRRWQRRLLLHVGGWPDQVVQAIWDGVKQFSDIARKRLT